MAEGKGKKSRTVEEFREYGEEERTRREEGEGEDSKNVRARAGDVRVQETNGEERRTRGRGIGGETDLYYGVCSSNVSGGIRT